MTVSRAAVRGFRDALPYLAWTMLGCSGGGQAKGDGGAGSLTSGATTSSVTSSGGATSTLSSTPTSTSTVTSEAASSTSSTSASSTSASSTSSTSTLSTSAGGSSTVGTVAGMGGSSSTSAGGVGAQSTSSESTNAAGGTTGAGGSGMSGCEGGGGAGPIVLAHTGAWRIMPLGDSITETTCYPQLLSKTLIDGGHTNFEFVGTVLNNQACGATNVDTEGHGGYLVTDLVGSGQHASEPAGWFAADQAEVVVMHFGTNDVWNNVPTAQITAAYSEVLSGIRAANPNVIVFVAQIVDMNPDGCSECSSRVQALNAAIPDWASSETTCDSPIYVVDLFTGFSTASDTMDGVHPNPGGSQKMADTMAAALVDVGLP